MKIRAVICDVYKTILEVGSPPNDAEARWNALCVEIFNGVIPFPLPEFHFRCDKIIAREHAQARAVGIAFPEIFWPDVAVEALPHLSSLAVGIRDDFLFHHACMRHSIRLMPGAAHALGTLADRGIILGIASNAQPYTLREFDEAFATAGLSRSLFRPELTFWSFEHGFSKPDPHVFRLLSARLRAAGITPDETLMIGDRWENDIEPAKAQGWHSWQFSSETTADAGGDWMGVCDYVFSEDCRTNAKTRPVH